MEKITYSELLEKSKSIFLECASILENKCKDYASDDDAFKNLKFLENFGFDTGDGIIYRLGDKFSRLCNLYKKGIENNAVKNESIQDTIKDFINYLVLLTVYLEKNKETGSIDITTLYKQDVLELLRKSLELEIKKEE